MGDEKKQVALVTGGSGGIGRAIAAALGASGRHVIVNYNSNETAAAETAGLVEKAGGTAEIVQFDVTDTAATEKKLTALLEKHGGIDILINNAGTHKDMLMVWMERPDWNDVIDTSLGGFYNVTRLVVKEMLLNRSGRIVNISSTSGQAGMPGQVNYSAAKAGLIGATKALAKEVAKRGITVNAVAPGFIETEMIEELPKDEILKTVPAGRFGKPGEVAALVLFLCSDEAAYITGQVIGINGGII
ncbi:MAG: 3-oxoacyl-ACP reductase FabG [Planctomycetota bacterium]|nr:MAG: 3-oxoacyl-ACP reductase FabG [Planctomycetota bacterium]